MTTIGFLHGILESVVYYLKFILESLAVASVAGGLVAVLAMVIGVLRQSREFLTIQQTIRLKFGTYLAMALEFQLAADILATTVKYDFWSLIELGMLAVIRTFLNYFLQKELEAEKKHVMAQLNLQPGDSA